MKPLWWFPRLTCTATNMYTYLATISSKRGLCCGFQGYQQKCIHIWLLFPAKERVSKVTVYSNRDVLYLDYHFQQERGLCDGFQGYRIAGNFCQEKIPPKRTPMYCAKNSPDLISPYTRSREILSRCVLLNQHVVD